MRETIEDTRTEFKVKLVDDLEESVIAFLNKDGGNIYWIYIKFLDTFFGKLFLYRI